MNTETYMTREHHHEADARTIFGFWIYIMSDCVLFACLFATFAVLRGNTFGGPSAKELFSLPYVLAETILLLTSSFTYGLAMLSAHHNKKGSTLAFLIVTFFLGLGFLGMEISEFARMAADGNGWQRSGFLSSFFTLVGTHGTHVTIGLLWMLSVFMQVKKHGLNFMTFRKLTCLGLFWHFLDIVWIFIFTFVYLFGMI